MNKAAAARGSQKGSELLEFVLVLLPFMALVGVLLDVGWAVFVKSSMQRAVRVAVEQGVSLSSSQLAPGACLTDTVKGIVQQNSAGMLQGSAGLAFIKVNYFQPPAPGSNGAVTDVSAQSNADAPGNIMQVSIQNFSLNALMPRIFGPTQGVDNAPTALTVYAAGVIQLTQTQPCVGTAP
jgi:Flp pilus assembly protein TadG